MNKKLILICICALALTCAGLQALAQDKPDQPAPQTNPGSQTNPQPSTDSSQAHVSDTDTASMVDARLQQLTTELGLSDDQKGQIKPILLDAATVEAVKNDKTRTIEAKKAKMDEVHDNARGQIRQFLTPDQGREAGCHEGGRYYLNNNLTDHKWGRRKPFPYFLFRFFLQRRQQLVIHLPIFQHLDGNAHTESGPHQPAKNPRGFFVIAGLLQPFALEVGPRQLFFIDRGVDFIHYLFDHVLVHAFHFEISDYSTAAELLIVTAKAGVSGGVIRITQIFLVFQTQDDHLHQQMAAFIFGDALAHQALQFGDG